MHVRSWWRWAAVLLYQELVFRHRIRSFLASNPSLPNARPPPPLPYTLPRQMLPCPSLPFNARTSNHAFDRGALGIVKFTVTS